MHTWTLTQSIKILCIMYCHGCFIFLLTLPTICAMGYQISRVGGEEGSTSKIISVLIMSYELGITILPCLCDFKFCDWKVLLRWWHGSYTKHYSIIMTVVITNWEEWEGIRYHLNKSENLVNSHVFFPTKFSEVGPNINKVMGKRSSWKGDSTAFPQSILPTKVAISVRLYESLESIQPPR